MDKTGHRADADSGGEQSPVATQKAMFRTL
jgi:hypothetical protein